MNDSGAMVAETEVIGAVKILSLSIVSLFSGLYTGVVAVVGADSSNTIAIGTTLGVSVTFAGLILRMVIKNQSAIWEIVRSKDEEIRQLKLEKEYIEWDREQIRFRAKERMTDPGPFTPSPSLLIHSTNNTTN